MNGDVVARFRSVVGEDSHLHLEPAYDQDRARFYITDSFMFSVHIGDRWFYVSQELEDSIMSWIGFDHDLYNMLLALGLGVKASFVASVQSETQ